MRVVLFDENCRLNISEIADALIIRRDSGKEFTRDEVVLECLECVKSLYEYVTTLNGENKYGELSLMRDFLGEVEEPVDKMVRFDKIYEENFTPSKYDELKEKVVDMVDWRMEALCRNKIIEYVGKGKYVVDY